MRDVRMHWRCREELGGGCLYGLQAMSPSASTKPQPQVVANTIRSVKQALSHVLRGFLIVDYPVRQTVSGRVHLRISVQWWLMHIPHDCHQVKQPLLLHFGHKAFPSGMDSGLFQDINCSSLILCPSPFVAL